MSKKTKKKDDGLIWTNPALKGPQDSEKPQGPQLKDRPKQDQYSKPQNNTYDKLATASRVTKDVASVSEAIAAAWRLGSLASKVATKAIKAVAKMSMNSPDFYDQISGIEGLSITTAVPYSTVNRYLNAQFPGTSNRYGVPQVAVIDQYPCRGSSSGRNFVADTVTRQLKAKLKSTLNLKGYDVDRYIEAAVFSRRLANAVLRYIRIGYTNTIINPNLARDLMIACLPEEYRDNPNTLANWDDEMPTIVSRLTRFVNAMSTLFPFDCALFERIDNEYRWLYADADNAYAVLNVYVTRHYSTWWGPGKAIHADETTMTLTSILQMMSDMTTDTPAVFNDIGAAMLNAGMASDWNFPVSKVYEIPMLPVYDKDMIMQIKNSYAGPSSAAINISSASITAISTIVDFWDDLQHISPDNPIYDELYQQLFTVELGDYDKPFDQCHDGRVHLAKFTLNSLENLDLAVVHLPDRASPTGVLTLTGANIPQVNKTSSEVFPFAQLYAAARNYNTVIPMSAVADVATKVSLQGGQVAEYARNIAMPYYAWCLETDTKTAYLFMFSRNNLGCIRQVHYIVPTTTGAARLTVNSHSASSAATDISSVATTSSWNDIVPLGVNVRVVDGAIVDKYVNMNYDHVLFITEDVLLSMDDTATSSLYYPRKMLTTLPKNVQNQS